MGWVHPHPTSCSKTKIVATIGPTSCDRESLFRLADAGMSVVRLNMSHGDHNSHKVGQGDWSSRPFGARSCRASHKPVGLCAVLVPMPATKRGPRNAC